MKHNMKKVLLMTCLLAMSSSAHAIKFIIYTDEPSGQASEKIAETMKGTYPFNKFNVEFEIVKIDQSELDCQSSNGVERAITCNNKEGFQADALLRGGDQAMIVKNSDKYGGSSVVGGGVPVVTSSSPPRIMIHEYLHSLGLCDEYEYKKEEADAQCASEVNRKTPNLVMITPEDPYNADMAARRTHQFDIPWYKDILPTTPITNAGGKYLGTGDVNFSQNMEPNNTGMASVLSEPSGLYKGKSCKNATRPKVVWHPGGSSTIMDKIENGLGAPLEKIVERILASKGAPKKMQVVEETQVIPKRYIAAGEQPVYASAPAPVPAPVEVNDSSRGFFKSFFDMLQNVLNTMTRAWTK